MFESLRVCLFVWLCSHENLKVCQFCTIQLLCMFTNWKDLLKLHSLNLPLGNKFVSFSFVITAGIKDWSWCLYVCVVFVYFKMHA